METKEQTNEFQTVTSSWTDNIENVIKDIEKSCSEYKWTNINSAKKASLRYTIFMYVLITLGSVSGLLSLISFADERYQNVLQNMVTFFSFSTSIISGILKFSKFEQKSSMYKSMAGKYASLESNIRRQLSLERQDRVNPGKYLEWVSISFDELFSSFPILGNKTETKVEEKIAKITINDVKEPENYGSSVSPVSPASLASITSPVSPGRRNSDLITKSTRYDDGKMKYELARLSAFASK